MIEVVHNVIPLEFAIVIVGMHISCNWLVQAGVQVAKEVATLLWSQIEHEDEPAHVDQHRCYDQTVHPLEDGIQPVLRVGLQVAECKHEDDYRVDAAPDVGLFDFGSSLRVGGQFFQVVVLETVKPDKGEGANEHQLYVVGDIWDEWGHPYFQIYLIEK